MRSVDGARVLLGALPAQAGGALCWAGGSVPLLDCLLLCYLPCLPTRVFLQEPIDFLKTESVIRDFPEGKSCFLDAGGVYVSLQHAQDLGELVADKISMWRRRRG